MLGTARIGRRRSLCEIRGRGIRPCLESHNNTTNDLHPAKGTLNNITCDSPCHCSLLHHHPLLPPPVPLLLRLATPPVHDLMPSSVNTPGEHGQDPSPVVLEEARTLTPQLGEHEQQNAQADGQAQHWTSKEVHVIPEK